MALRPRVGLVRSRSYPGLRAVSDVSLFGFVNYSTAALPDRLYTGLDAAERPPSVLHSEADIDVTHIPTPLECLVGADGEPAPTWPVETKRAVARLEALWLLAEDRFRLLDAQEVEPLAHQASLVEHVLATPDLTRVLIADEVGLGKTVEAGLLVKRLAERATTQPRVLYLTEARLVRNVMEEFTKLGLRPREWSTAVQEARLAPGDSDPLVIASMHRAVVNADLVAASGPWDVLIVDEAHHLTDWSEDGSDPQQRMRLVRKLVRERLTPDGRVYLLSGTPHQGSEERFKNLLRLLSGRDDERGARGRVIYRIKDDITNWDGKPLFPKRRVNPPTEVDAGERYTRWLADVHELLTPLVPSRAAGWRRAQALQWCASSPQAGVAYLARLAFRAGMAASSLPVLRDAVAALRPYRGGPADEPAAVVEARLMYGQSFVDDEPDGVFADPRRGLRHALEEGVALIEEDAIGRKLERVFEWMNAADDEKFVVFAQPVDTVFTLKYRLEREYGAGAVSIIVGEQKPEARRQEIERFWSDPGRRVLVSSRSGGEGINLQVARRLVHFDVPWNPMEMEQRVGRIHRYGSADTVIVETLVLKDSREHRVLARSRARLGRIARDLDQDRLELLFSRTMALIPLEELAALMAGENFGPLTQADQDRIDRLITEGYQRWQQKDQEFRQRSERLLEVERGASTDADFVALLTGALGSHRVPGWQHRTLEDGADGGDFRVIETEADVFELPDGALGFVGRDAGVGLAGPAANGRRPRRIGLNDRTIVETLREVVGGGDAQGRGAEALVRGAGVTLVPDSAWRELLTSRGLPAALAGGAILLAYLTRRLDTGPQMRELGADMHFWLLDQSAATAVPLPAAVAADVVRLIRAPRPKRTRPGALNASGLLDWETERLNELRRRQPGEPVVAVFPIAAVWIEPTAERPGGAEPTAGDGFPGV